MSPDTGTQVERYVGYFDEVAPPITFAELERTLGELPTEAPSRQLIPTARRGLLVAATAAIVVILAGLLTLLLSGGEEDIQPLVTTPVTTPVPPTEPSQPDTTTPSPVTPAGLGAITWTEVPTDTASRLWDTAYGAAYGGDAVGEYPDALVGNELVDNIFAVGSGFLFPASTTELLRSTDGIEWAPIAMPTANVHNMAQAGSWVVLLGEDTNRDPGAWRTKDGVSWEQIDSPSNPGVLDGAAWLVEGLALTESGDVSWALGGPGGERLGVISIVNQQIRELVSPPWDTEQDGSWIVDLGSKTVAYGRQPPVEVDGETTYPIGWWELVDEQTWTPQELPFEVDWQCGLGWVGPKDGKVFVNIECGGPWLWSDDGGNTWETPNDLEAIMDEGSAWLITLVAGDSMWLAVSNMHELGDTPDASGDLAELAIVQFWISVDGILWEKLDMSHVPSDIDNGRDLLGDESKAVFENDIAKPMGNEDLVIGVAGDTVFVSVVDSGGPNPDFVTIRLVGRYEP